MKEEIKEKESDNRESCHCHCDHEHHEHNHDHHHGEHDHNHEHEHHHEHCDEVHSHDDCHTHHEHDHSHGGCCSCGHSHGHHDDDSEKELSVKSLVLAGILFIIGIVIEHLQLTTCFAGVKNIETIHKAIFMVLYFAAYMITGKGVIIGAIKNIIHREFLDEVFLMSVASIGAILLGKYEEATAIMILYQIGEKFEDYAVDKSRDSIEAISKLRPDHATLKVGNETREVSPDDVKTDSIIIVKPGDRIPIDGIVTDGDSFIDTSALTGESIPRHVKVGDNVLSGSINKQGVLEIRTTKHAGESALARILDLVENATENKTKSEQFVTHADCSCRRNLCRTYSGHNNCNYDGKLELSSDVLHLGIPRIDVLSCKLPLCDCNFNPIEFLWRHYGKCKKRHFN